MKLKIRIKPAKNSLHTASIQHGQKVLVTETLKNKSDTRKMLANIIKEIQDGNFELTEVDLKGKVVKKYLWLVDEFIEASKDLCKWRKGGLGK